MTTSDNTPSAARHFTWRDRLAHRLANTALCLASADYRSFVRGAIRYGMDAAARDAREGRDLPPPWDATSAAYSERE